MSDTGDPAGGEGPGLPPDLRFLKALVTVLAATMILGLITLVGVFVIRFPGPPPLPALPASVRLPEGAVPEAVTFGRGWVAVVAEGRILVYDSTTGALRQEVPLSQP